MTRHYLRRAVLATIGTAAAGSTVGAKRSTGYEPRDRDDCCERRERCESTCDRGRDCCERDDHHDDEFDDHHDERDRERAVETARIGTIELYNRSECSRQIRIAVRGHIAEEGQESYSTTLGPGERETIEFIGRMRTLDMEHGDIDVQIEQRSAEEASREACHDDGSTSLFD